MDTPSTQPSPEAPRPASGENLQASEVPAQPDQAAPAETAPNASQTAPIAPPGLPVDDAVAAATPPPTTAPVTDTPAIADDVDVIEKEWVDKADEVIKQTKDDPYQEEEKIEDLQVDYLKKRYGKDIKQSDNGNS